MVTIFVSLKYGHITNNLTYSKVSGHQSVLDVEILLGVDSLDPSVKVIVQVPILGAFFKLSLSK